MKISQPHPKIKIYDNVYTWQEQRKLYLACRGAPYKIGWNDTVDSSEGYLHSEITPEMWENIDQLDPSIQNFMQTLVSAKPFQEMTSHQILNTVINCDTIADTHYPHTHEFQDVILYYANLEWNHGWEGETMFYDEAGKEIIYTCPYTPNRMIKFDGSIIHNFSGPASSGPKFRFSISTFYWKIPEEN